MSNPLDQLPPMDERSEWATVASMALCGDDRITFAAITRELRPGVFLDPDLEAMCRVMVEMHREGRLIDFVSLSATLRERGIFDEVGGMTTIARLAEGGPPSYRNGPEYARAVSRCAKRREVIRLAGDLAKRMNNPIDGENADEVVVDAIAKLQGVAFSSNQLRVWSIGEAAGRWMDARMDGRSSIAQEVGIPRLDTDYAGTFTRGGYTLVAARPSMGKSTFLRWLLWELAKAGTRCGLIAVEEFEDKIVGNILSAETLIENSVLAYGAERWTTDDMLRVGEGVKQAENKPLFGVDTAQTLRDVLAAAEMLLTQHQCRIIAVDHIHLIEHGRARSDTRALQLAEISAALKHFFKRHGVVGVVAAQLNRPERMAVPPPPRLTDLRDSGALEEHADGVLMLHREDYYRRDEKGYTPDRLMQVLVRKNRNGGVGEFVLRADLKHHRFEEVGGDPF